MLFFLAHLISCSQNDEITPEEELCIDKDLIDETAACYLIYAPVCGCDNKTYSNDCIASSNGVLSYTAGACDE